MTYTKHHQWEYQWSADDVLDRHDNPHNTPIHYPDFSDKRWRGIYHTHRKAMRLLELDELSRYSIQLANSRRQLISVLDWIRSMKDKKHIQSKNEKIRAKTIAQLKSGNRPKSIQQILTTDYSDLEDNFMVWLWVTTLFANKNAHTKWIRSSTRQVLEHIKPILQQRWLPLEWVELKNYFNQIPPEELKEYWKAATGHTL